MTNVGFLPDQDSNPQAMEPPPACRIESSPAAAVQFGCRARLSDRSPGPLAVAESILTRAIAEATVQRQRAAVMLIDFAPRCAFKGAAPCCDLGLPTLLDRAGTQPGEWGPLRLDETGLIVIAQGFQDSVYIQRRAAVILESLESGCCPRGFERILDCAIGIGLFPEDGDTASALLLHAEQALHDLRAIGHNAAGFNLSRQLTRRRMRENSCESARAPNRCAVFTHEIDSQFLHAESTRPRDLVLVPCQAADAPARRPLQDARAIP